MPLEEGGAVAHVCIGFVNKNWCIKVKGVIH